MVLQRARRAEPRFIFNLGLDVLQRIHKRLSSVERLTNA